MEERNKTFFAFELQPGSNDDLQALVTELTDQCREKELKTLFDNSINQKYSLMFLKNSVME